MGCERKDRIQKVAEWSMEIIASKFGMGDIQADSHLLLFAKVGSKFVIYKEIVESLTTEMPWEWWHCLWNDLHLSICLEFCQAFNQALS